MTSVGIDLFDMPRFKVEDKFFDQMAVCVDRHSGWVVAVPMVKKGLTGEKVAKEMLKVLWRPFGIPSIVTSDQGSHFISNWWQTLCANLGIRLAYAQAYHHQANGRAERAGKQIIDRARKVQAETKISWVEALPQILDRHHDTLGEGGYSPSEILFGRERPLGGLP
jgi:transposase InsO family protein